jgi:urease accessory protein
MVSQHHSWFGLTAGVRRVLVMLAFACLGQPGDALAHHMIDGELPQNFLDGFLSGFAHPIIGFDHFAFILAAGLIAAKVARGATLPLIFLGASMAGCVVHLAGLTVTGAEIVVAISVVGVGAFLVADKRVHRSLLVTGFALAGAFHGYAYGESIVGAEPAPLAAYLMGLIVIQYAVAMGAFTAARQFDGRSWLQRDSAMRAAGVVVCMAGAVALALAI